MGHSFAARILARCCGFYLAHIQELSLLALLELFPFLGVLFHCWVGHRLFVVEVAHATVEISRILVLDALEGSVLHHQFYVQP